MPMFVGSALYLFSYVCLRYSRISVCVVFEVIYLMWPLVPFSLSVLGLSCTYLSTVGAVVTQGNRIPLPSSQPTRVLQHPPSKFVLCQVVVTYSYSHLIITSCIPAVLGNLTQRGPRLAGLCWVRSFGCPSNQPLNAQHVSKGLRMQHVVAEEEQGPDSSPSPLWQCPLRFLVSRRRHFCC